MIAKYEAIYKDIAAKCKLECPVPVSEKTGKLKNNAAHRLLTRLEKYDIEAFSFMYDFDIPFDNKIEEYNREIIKGREYGTRFCKRNGYRNDNEKE